MKPLTRIVSFFLLALAVVLAAPAAGAKVRKAGTWPADEKKITIDGDALFRDRAVLDVAAKAGWSMMVPWKDADHRIVPGDRVDLHVKDEPADKVLEMLLAGGSYVATREGNRVVLALDDVADAKPADKVDDDATRTAAPPDAAADARETKVERVPPSKKGEDRVITGGNLEVRKDDIVHDVSVFGGSVDVYGTVTGDLAVTGGSARIHDGAWVMGDATAIGGSLVIEDGARVDRDVGVVGGSLRRGDKAELGGKVVDPDKKGSGRVHVKLEDGKPETTVLGPGEDAPKHKKGFLHETGESLTNAALLFVVGTVLLALGSRRMETLRAEVAARPMRSFAMGIVGIFLAALTLVVLCVSVVGIPVAILSVPLLVVAVLAGLAATLTTLGQALMGHKTQSPYAHLALGCALYFVLGILPVVGGFVHLAAILIGIGALFATRAAGIVPGKAAPPFAA
jgi:hypothetical protein